MPRLIDIVFGFYRIVISPLLGRNCRYAPSCSLYTKQAIELHGWFKGGYLGLKRIARCHPWGGHGVDPVPGSPEALSGEYSHEKLKSLKDQREDTT